MYAQSETVYGTQFNEMMSEIIFIKLLNKNHKYINGLNTCKTIKFYQKHMVHYNIKNKKLDLSSYAIIKIPFNAYVTINNINCKTDRAILDIYNIDQLDILNDESYVNNLVNFNADMIKYIKIQTYDACRTAITVDKNLFKYIKQNNEKYNDLCLHLVSLYEDGLKFIQNQTEELILHAVKDHPISVIYIDKKIQSYELYLEIVKLNKSVLQYIHPEYKTNELLFTAIMSNGKAVKYIEDVTDEMIYYLIHNDPECIKYVKNLSKEHCEILLDINPYYAKYISNPPLSAKDNMIKVNSMYAVLFDNSTEEELIDAVKENPDLFLRIKNPSINICKVMIDNDPSYIELMNNPSDEIILYTINKDPDYLDLLYLSEKQMIMIIKNNPQYIKYIDEDLQTYAPCLIAVQNDGILIEYINRVFHTEELIKCAMITYPEAINYLDNIANMSYETYLEILNTTPEIFKNLKNKNIKPSHVISTIIDNPSIIQYFNNFNKKSMMVLSLVNPLILEYIGNKRIECDEFINHLKSNNL